MTTITTDYLEHGRTLPNQRANAGFLMDASGAIRLDQVGFTPERLAAEITAPAAAPGRMARMAPAAQAAGSTVAAERLSGSVLRVWVWGPPSR